MARITADRRSPGFRSRVGRGLTSIPITLRKMVIGARSVLARAATSSAASGVRCRAAASSARNASSAALSARSPSNSRWATASKE